ncbi:MAG: LLM class flavin-dependent oxidoreductase [Streptosporangiales bacterium]|nr:LLM class flavin-dependent oxidoreductase [Streptosporangiales bacterium]
MTTFGLSMGISPREPTRRVVDLASRAEGAGIDALWMIDSQLVMRDAYMCLATAASSTSSLKLGTGVTNPFTRHATVTANAISTLDELSAGRAMLGVGAGDSALFPIGMKPASIKEMRTWLTQVGGLLAGEQVTFAESHVALTTARRVPIFLSASQPRMIRLAGQYADGVILMGIASPDLIEMQLSQLREGLREAGRQDSDIVVDYWATISIRDDLDEATREVKSWASAQARWLSRWKEVPPSLEKFRAEAQQAAATYDFGQHLSVKAGHADVVSDEFVRLAAIAGDREHCLTRLRDIADLGVDRITLTLLSGGREERLERFHDLIAEFRSRSADSPVAKDVSGV